MIYGIGVDTVAIDRFRDWVGNRKKLERFFHGVDREYIYSLPGSGAGREGVRRGGGAYAQQRAIAGRYAVKEAFGKALGSGMLDMELRDIAVSRSSVGAPQVVLFNDLSERMGGAGWRNHVSISYTDEYATAYVIIEQHQSAGQGGSE